MAYESLLTVVSAAASRDLVTLGAAAAECGTDMQSIPDLGLLVAAASEAIENYTGRRWVSESIRETFRGSGQGVMRLLLARAPVVTITAVSVDGESLNLATEVECATDAGILYRLDLDQRVQWGGRTVVVEYVGGYTPPGASGANMPAVLQRVAAKIVAGWYHGQGQDPRLRSRTIEDVGSKSWIDPTPEDLGLPPGLAGILEPLRRKRL